jgi:sulfite exporter TauE/SafE
MALFGLANTPMLLGISEIKTWLPSSWQKQVQRWSGMLTATIAIILILRGLNLGIPLLSPEVAAQDSGAPVKCSHR